VARRRAEQPAVYGGIDRNEEKVAHGRFRGLKEIFCIVGIKLCWGLYMCGLAVAPPLACSASLKSTRMASGRHCRARWG